MVTNYDLTLLNFRDLLRKFYLLLEIIDFVSANVIMPCTIKWASVYSFLKHSCSNVLVYTFIHGVMTVIINTPTDSDAQFSKISLPALRKKSAA